MLPAPLSRWSLEHRGFGIRAEDFLKGVNDLTHEALRLTASMVTGIRLASLSRAVS